MGASTNSLPTPIPQERCAEAFKTMYRRKCLVMQKKDYDIDVWNAFKHY
jgi:hypothetical protein